MKTDIQFIRYTGAVIRMCECGADKWPPSHCLEIFSDGKVELAHCPECKKTWDAKTLKEVK